MKSHATKTTSPALQSQKGSQPFFQKNGQQSLFASDQIRLKPNYRKTFFGEKPGSSPFFTPPSIQAKLTIGQPGDKYEQEADAMADKVVQTLRNPGAAPTVQTKCADCAKEEPELQSKPIFESEQEQPGVQTKAASGDGPTAASSDLESRLNTSRGSGSPLPEDTQASMGSAFGADFGNVRVHTGQSAVQMNQELGAQAFTHGSDVYFNAGKYDTQSSGGQRLLAHELTHVVQQQQSDFQVARSTRKISENYSLAENLQNALSPTSTQDHKPQVQLTLNTDLQGLLGVYGPVHYEGVVNAIRAASVAERQVAVANSTVLNLIHTRLSPAYGSAVISELLVGSQNWANPPATDFYTHFVLNNGSGAIPTNRTMNCWESILYSAHLSGQVSAAWIRNYYISAGALPGTTINPTPRLWAQLGFTTTLPTYNPSTGNIPTFGQLVFYVSAGSPIPGHVAVYVGNGEVISLWTRPNNINSIQRIPITALSGTIYYGNTPW